MIVLSVIAPVKPESRDAFIAAARAITAETRKEAGSISYAFSSDIDDANRFYVTEQWKDQDALDSHFGTPHMVAFKNAIGELLAGDLIIKRFVVETAETL